MTKERSKPARAERAPRDEAAEQWAHSALNGYREVAEKVQAEKLARIERAIRAAEQQADALGRLAAAVERIAGALLVSSPVAAPAKQRPVAPAKAEVGAKEPEPAKEWRPEREDVRRGMVAVAEKRGGEFLTALLRREFKADSIKGIPEEQYGRAYDLLVSAYEREK